ncbi:Guanine nucleotide-binding protein alpha-3 subunit [Ancistrocladus abbreviatus]
MAAAAAAKSPVSRSSKAALLMLLLLIAFTVQLIPSQAQNCPAELNNLNVCAPFVVPGANGTPSSECCGALQSVQHDCLCNTLRIASRLPSMCNIPPITCAN